VHAPSFHMTIQSIEYASSHRPSRRVPVRLIVIVLVCLAFFAMPFVTVRQTRSRMDAITGSIEWRTDWVFGFRTGPWIEVSPLENRLRKIGVQWSADWRFLHNTHRTIFGRATCYECGTAPQIYQLRSVMQQFVNASSDDEVRALVRILESGTEEEQRAAVEATGEKILGY